MIRTFLAVELSEPLRANLSRLQLDLRQQLAREIPRGVRMSWVQPASMHLTVKFFGDIDDRLVSPMREAIGPVVGANQVIHIPLDRLGVFPRLQQPRVLWVGPSDQWERGEDAKRLASLHGAIEDICRSLDFAPDDRPLSPHLTLARVKEGERQMGQILAKSGVMDRPPALESLTIDSIVLIKSDLKPTGSVYTKLWEAKLGAGGN
jgi:RNA 2',3'-cyclic 3'-phosphodiesterase